MNVLANELQYVVLYTHVLLYTHYRWFTLLGSSALVHV